jgi:hypothetical protein
MITPFKADGKSQQAFPFSVQLLKKIQKLQATYGYGFMGPFYEIVTCIEMVEMLKNKDAGELRETAAVLSQKRLFKQITTLLTECKHDLPDAVSAVILLVQEYRDSAFADAVQDKCFALWRKDSPERETYITLAKGCMDRLQTLADTVPRYRLPYDKWQAHSLSVAELNRMHNFFLRIDL